MKSVLWLLLFIQLVMRFAQDDRKFQIGFSIKNKKEEKYSCCLELYLDLRKAVISEFFEWTESQDISGVDYLLSIVLLGMKEFYQETKKSNSEELLSY